MYIHFSVCVCVLAHVHACERGREKEQWTDTGVKYYCAQYIQAAVFFLASPHASAIPSFTTHTLAISYASELACISFIFTLFNNSISGYNIYNIKTCTNQEYCHLSFHRNEIIVNIFCVLLFSLNIS